VESDNSYVKEPKKKRSDGKTPAQRTAQAKKAWETMRKKNAGKDGDIINPILDKIINNMKVISFKQTAQYKEQVEKWEELLAEEDPWIEEEKFVKLFNMYNFDVSKPEQEDWFSFKISARLAPGESQQDILVILQKLSGVINEVYMKTLPAKLQNNKAVIISITNDNPLNFPYDTDKICHIDKDLLECLLYYRTGVINRGNVVRGTGLYGFIRKKQKI